MTPKQILDSFSDTLMQDDRILSAQERALLTNVLQHARSATGESLEMQQAVRTVIASAVGETVAQRAFAVLGGSIVERILGTSASLGIDSANNRTEGIYAKDPQPPRGTPLRPGQPQPPAKGPTPPLPPNDPQPPRVRKPSEPQAPGHHEPQSPGKPLGDPQPPRSVHASVVSETKVAVAERPAMLPAQCVVLDEFLAPQELAELTRYTLEHEADFTASEVVAPTEEGGVINYEHRRSRVLMDMSQHENLMLERIQAVLPQILPKLGMEAFPIAGAEVQVTASNDGDFFRFHSDNSSDRVASRYLTFVYFFHREPQQFEGGELRIHDARLEAGTYVSDGTYQTIVPRQNQIVFFPCELLHEITPVNCPSRLFADSRFTLNGWLRR